VQADRGAIVQIHFSAGHAELSRDGMGAKYRDVFPGIDLKVYRNRADFEYDWIVTPGADPGAFASLVYRFIKT
jgi:hypothetical protein